MLHSASEASHSKVRRSGCVQALNLLQPRRSPHEFSAHIPSSITFPRKERSHSAAAKLPLAKETLLAPSLSKRQCMVPILFDFLCVLGVQPIHKLFMYLACLSLLGCEIPDAFCSRLHGLDHNRWEYPYAAKGFGRSRPWSCKRPGLRADLNLSDQRASPTCECSLEN